MRVCGIIFPGGEYDDKIGCSKPCGHNNSHIFRAENGKFVEWEEDYNCETDCDCWEEGDPCLVYSEL